MEALYAPLANPIGELAALRAAELLSGGIGAAEPRRPDLGLGALLAGYSSGVSGFAILHVICQTIVRVTGVPHARTYAVMLPHVARWMQARAAGAMTKLARAIGEPSGDAAPALGRLASRAEVHRLGELGIESDQAKTLVEAVMARPDASATTPGGVRDNDVQTIIEEAL
jgi:maleylacetate reductase